VLIGLVPARQAVEPDIADLLRSTGLAGSRRGTYRRRSLIILEIALSVALVTATLIAWRNAASLGEIDPGYDAAHVLSVNVALSQNRYAGNEQTLQFHHAVAERVSALPGVRAAAVSGTFDRFTDDLRADSLRAYPQLETRDALRSIANMRDVEVQSVDPSYLEATGLPLVRGRFFGAQDRSGGTWTAVLSEGLARELWPGQDPLGREIRVDSLLQRWAVVIGVVGDRVRVNSAPQSMRAEPRRTVYFSTGQTRLFHPAVLVRTAGDPTLHMAAVRAAVREIDAEQPITRAETLLDQEVGAARQAMRVFGGAMGAIGVAGLLLAVVGMYGLISHTAAQRTREIGVRMALGAAPRVVARAVLADAVRITAIGLGVGFVLTLGLTRLARGILFGFAVAGMDPVAYAAAAAVFGSVAIAAAWLPARRAMAVDPLVAIRSL
jgi:predicted permease